MKNYDLGTEKIGRLVRHFSVPCVISMLVAALYNIVDQIFIGWSSAGAFGNTATNIVYPFTVLALGLSLLVGDGAAANFSLESGRKDKDRADKSVGNGFLLLIIFSILLCLMGFICKSQILKLFGANPEEKVYYDFAVQYFTVICACRLTILYDWTGNECFYSGRRLSKICNVLYPCRSNRKSYPFIMAETRKITQELSIRFNFEFFNFKQWQGL